MNLSIKPRADAVMAGQRDNLGEEVKHKLSYLLEFLPVVAPIEKFQV